VIRTGRMSVNLSTRTVEIDGKPLHVTGKEYAILELLSLRKGMTLTKEMFLDHLYGGMDEPEQKIVDVFICKLRKKIAAVTDDHGIETVWGRGYTLKDAGVGAVGLAEDAMPFRGADMPADGPAALVSGRAEGRELTELDLLLLQLFPNA
jgi:two-component system, cell cycle response regulator CtrA